MLNVSAWYWSKATLEAARSLEVNANMLGRWIKEHQEDEKSYSTEATDLLNELNKLRKAAIIIAALFFGLLVGFAYVFLAACSARSFRNS